MVAAEPLVPLQFAAPPAGVQKIFVERDIGVAGLAIVIEIVTVIPVTVVIEPGGQFCAALQQGLIGQVQVTTAVPDAVLPGVEDRVVRTGRDAFLPIA